MRNSCRNRTVFFVALLLGSVVSACNSGKQNPQLSDQEVKDILLKMNKADARLEDRDIDLYLQERGWIMQQTGTGLRYQIYHVGQGDSIEMGDHVIIDYSVALFDSTLCYSSKKNGPKSLKLGQSDVETGLHEALDMLRNGDSARIVLPSHLAHGISGDGDCIPSRASVIYDVSVRSVTKANP